MQQSRSTQNRVATPSEQLVIVDSSNKRVDVEKLTDELRQDDKRVLADDELGTVLYVGDLDLYSLKPTRASS